MGTGGHWETLRGYWVWGWGRGCWVAVMSGKQWELGDMTGPVGIGRAVVSVGGRGGRWAL